MPVTFQKTVLKKLIEDWIINYDAVASHRIRTQKLNSKLEKLNSLNATTFVECVIVFCLVQKLYTIASARIACNINQENVKGYSR